MSKGFQHATSWRTTISWHFLDLSMDAIEGIMTTLASRSWHCKMVESPSCSVAGPFSALRSLNYRVRPLGSLGLAFAAPTCEPGQDTFVTAVPRLNQFALGRPSLLAVRWPSATGLTSYLSGCFLSQASGAVCNIADVSEGFLRALPRLCFLPAACADFVPPFGVFL